MIHNPILPGFHSDPCICCGDDDYYLACSSFAWFPGVPVYHSRDLKHWQLLTHILTSNPVACDGRVSVEHLKPPYFNPAVLLRKADRGSIVQAPAGREKFPKTEPIPISWDSQAILRAGESGTVSVTAVDEKGACEFRETRMAAN